MANEFIIRKGFHAKAKSEITGSLTVTGEITGSSFTKDGSTADDILLGDGTTTSLSGIGTPPGTVSGSSQINYPEISNIPADIISGSSQLDGTTINNLTGSFTGSFVGDGSGLTGITSTPSAWQNITGSSYTAVDSGKYIADNVSRVVFAMPETNNLQTVRVTGQGLGGWQVDVPAGWNFTFVDEIITDNIQSTEISDSVELRCTGNSGFHIISSTGNITFNNL